AALTEAVLHAMLLTKLKVAAAMLIGLTLVGVSASAVLGPSPAHNVPSSQVVEAQKPEGKQTAAPKAAAEEPEGARPKRSHEGRGVVRASTGQPVAASNVYWLTPSYLRRTVRSLPKHGLPSQVEGELLQMGSSDAQGRFSLQAQLDADDRRIADRMTLIIAKAPKHGFGGMRYGSDTKNVE